NVEELKLIRGFEGQKYLQIADYVSAAPTLESKVNVNTASAMLLASLDPKLDVNAVQQALQQRQENLEYFSNINDLCAILPFVQVYPVISNEVNDLLGVQSSYFKAKSEVLLSGRKRQFISDLVRKDKIVFVAYRSMAPF